MSASGLSHASTSAHRTGVETVGSRPARSEYGAMVVFAGLFWLQSMNTFPGRARFAITLVTKGCSASSVLASRRAYSAVPCPRSHGT